MAVAVANRFGWPIKQPSPKNSSALRSATTADDGLLALLGHNRNFNFALFDIEDGICIRQMGQVQYANQNWTTNIQGVSANYPPITNWQIETGRGISHEDDSSAALIVRFLSGWNRPSAVDRKMRDEVAYYDEHGLNQQRAYQIVCLMVGFDDPVAWTLPQAAAARRRSPLVEDQNWRVAMLRAAAQRSPHHSAEERHKNDEIGVACHDAAERQPNRSLPPARRASVCRPISHGREGRRPNSTLSRW
jgi:hypothetical protein